MSKKVRSEREVALRERRRRFLESLKALDKVAKGPVPAFICEGCGQQPCACPISPI